MSETIRTGSQTPLFVESMEEAVEATAMACGGKKKFAVAIRPQWKNDPERAHRWFLDALNPLNRTEFHAEDLLMACQVAREHHCHILKHWFDNATGYERSQPAAPKTPEQDLANELASIAARYKQVADDLARKLAAVSPLKAVS